MSILSKIFDYFFKDTNGNVAKHTEVEIAPMPPLNIKMTDEMIKDLKENHNFDAEEELLTIFTQEVEKVSPPNQSPIIKPEPTKDLNQVTVKTYDKPAQINADAVSDDAKPKRKYKKKKPADKMSAKIVVKTNVTNNQKKVTNSEQKPKQNGTKKRTNKSKAKQSPSVQSNG